jgi:hypothetical protein
VCKGNDSSNNRIIHTEGRYTSNRSRGNVEEWPAGSVTYVRELINSSIIGIIIQKPVTRVTEEREMIKNHK